MSEADTVSSADVTGLNQAIVARGAKLARLIGTGLMVVAGLGVLAWAWLEVRSLDLFGEPFLDEDAGVADRVDALAAYVIILLYAALAAGVGVALRLGADYTVARTGGSLTGVRAGEPLPAVRRRPPGDADADAETEA
jgi:hypothetical protein